MRVRAAASVGLDPRSLLLWVLGAASAVVLQRIALVVLAALLSYQGPVVLSPTATPAKPAPEPLVREQPSLVASGTAGAVRVVFPASWSLSQREEWLERHDLTRATGGVAGEPLYQLPKVGMVQVSWRQAEVLFPSLMTPPDIAAFLAGRNLVFAHWTRGPRDPDFHGRAAMVQLPALQMNLSLVDPSRGLYQANLGAGLERAWVDEWAASAGQRVITYDEATGIAVVQPLNWRPPTVQPFQAATPRPQPIAYATTPAPPVAPPAPPNRALLLIQFKPELSAAEVGQINAQIGVQVLSVDVGNLVTASVDPARKQALIQLYSDNPAVECISESAGFCSSPPQPAPAEAPAAPAPPAFGPVTGVASDGAALSWRSAPGASSYAVFGAGSASGPYRLVARVTGIQLPLPSGYAFIRVTALHPCSEAMSGAGCDTSAPVLDPSFSSAPLALTPGQAEATSPPAAPASPQLSALDGHVTLSWAALSGVGGYRVYRGLAGGPLRFVGGTSATQFVDVGGTAGSTYRYQVASVSTNGLEGPASAAGATITWPATSTAPSIVRTSPAGSQVLSGKVVFSVDARSGDGRGTAAWSLTGPAGAANLGVANGQRSPHDPLSWSASTAWDTSRLPDGTYTLTTTATSASGQKTEVSQTFRIQNAIPTAPSGLSATAGVDGVTLTWQQPAVSHAAFYRLYRDQDAQPAATLPVDMRSYVDHPSAGTHSYRLVLIDAAGRASTPGTATASVPTSTSASQAQPHRPPDVRLLTPTGAPLADGGRATGRLVLVSSDRDSTFQFSHDGLAWQKVPGSLDCSTRCTQTWDLSGVEPGGYSVRAVAAGQAGPAHSLVVSIPAPLAAPGAPSLEVAPSGVALKWAPPPASSPIAYQIERSNGSDWIPLAVLQALNYTDTSAPAGTTIAYRVRAVSLDGTPGTPSTPASVEVPLLAPSDTSSGTRPSAPANVTAISSVGGVALTWEPVAGADGYSVQRGLGGAEAYSEIARVGPETSLYVDRSNLLAGNASYRVSAFGGQPSSPVSTTVIPAAAPQPISDGAAAPSRPSAPAKPTVTVTDSTATVSWTAVADPSAPGAAITYTVYRFDPAAGAFTLAAEGLTATRIVDSGLSPGQTYGYVVTATEPGAPESRYSTPAWAAVTGVPADSLSASFTPATLAELPAIGVRPVALEVAITAPAAITSVIFEAARDEGSEWLPLPQGQPNWPAGGGPAIAGTTPLLWGTTFDPTTLAAGAWRIRATVIDMLAGTAQTTADGFLGLRVSRGPPPFSLTLTPTPGGASIDWPTTPGTSYQVSRSVTGPDGPFKALALVTGGRYVDSGLVPGAVYTYSVRVAGAALAAAAQGTVIPLAAAASSEDGVDVEAGPITAAEVDVALTPAASAPILPAGLSLVGHPFEIDATDLATKSTVHWLDEPATLTVQLPDGLSAASLYHYEDSLSAWLVDSSAVDSQAHRLTALLPHFSIFAVASGSPSSPAVQPGVPPAPIQQEPQGVPLNAPPSAPSPAAPVVLGPDGEVLGLRTSQSKTYKQADGSFRRIVSAGLLNYQDATGGWQTIDTTLIPATAGSADVRNASGPLGVRLPARAGAITVSAPTGELDMGLVGAASAPIVTSGSTAVYTGVMPGVDAHYTIIPEGVSEGLAIATKPTGPLAFTYRLETIGLVLSVDRSGVVTATDGCGKAVFEMPAPWLEDSPARPDSVGAHSNAVAVSLTGGAGHYLLTYTPDAAWLADPSRRYPVTLDPTVITLQQGGNGGEVDSQIDSAYPNTNFYGNTYFPVGKDPNGGVYRDVMQFGNAVCDGCWANSATLSIYQYTNYRYGGQPLQAHTVGATWNASTLTWNNQPGWSGPVATASTLNGTGWVNFDATAVVQSWEENNPYPYGITLTNGNEGCACYNDELFYSWAYGTQAYRPQLTINYDTWLFSPSLVVAPGQTAETNLPQSGTFWIPAGGSTPVEVELRNTGSASWDSGVRLSYRWTDTNGNPLSGSDFNPRVYLPYNMSSNDYTVLRFPAAGAASIPQGGQVELQLALVKESVFWFQWLSWGSGSQSAVRSYNAYGASEASSVGGLGLPSVITAQTGAVLSIPVSLTNLSPSYTWKASDTGDLTRVGVREYRSASGAVIPYPVALTFLPADVGPGQNVNVGALLQMPSDPGDYWFHIDLVRMPAGYSNPIWFEDRGNQPLEVHVKVVAPGAAQVAQVPITENDGTTLGINSSNGYLTLSATDFDIEELGATRLQLTRSYNGVNASLPLNGTASSSPIYGVGWTFNFERNIQVGAWGGNGFRYGAGLYTDSQGKSWPVTWNPGRGLWEDAAGGRTVVPSSALVAAASGSVSVPGVIPVDVLQRNGNAFATDSTAPGAAAGNQALQLEGNTPAALIMPGARVPTQLSGSIELWFRPDFSMATDTAEHDVFADQNGNFLLTWNSSTNPGKFCFTTKDSTNTSLAADLCAVPATSWAQGTWHQIAVTWAAGGAKQLILDGGTAVSSPTHGQSPTGDLYFGYNPSGAKNSLNGAITELRLEGQALTSTQVSSDFSSKQVSGDSYTLYLGTFAASASSAYGTYTLINPDQTQEVFDPQSGRLLYDRDRYGNQVDYNFANGRISSIADDKIPSRAITFCYASASQACAGDTTAGDIVATDPGGRQITYSVNSIGDLVNVTKLDAVPDPITGTVTNTSLQTGYAYLPGHALQTITDPRRNATTVAYQGYQQAVLSDRPSAYYRLDEGSGTTAADSSGGSNAGTYNGGVTYGASGAIAGSSDPAVTLDGTTGYVTLPAAAFPAYPTSGSNSAYQVSFEAWFKTTSGGAILGQTAGCTPLGGSCSAGYVPAVYVASSGQVRESLFWQGGAQNLSSRTYNDGQWHHLVATYDNGTDSLYLDGVLVSTMSNADASYAGSYSYFLGAAQTANWTGGNNGWYLFKGSLDEVAVYGYALRPAQVQSHYGVAVQYSGAVLEDDPSPYYRLDDSGTSAADSSGLTSPAAVYGNVTRNVPGLVSSDSDTAMSFDGSTGYLSANSVAALQGDNSRSVELWFKTSSTAQQALFDSGTTGVNAQSFQIGLTAQGSVGSSPPANTPGVLVEFWSDTVYLPGLNLGDGRAHHLVVTLNGSSVYVYVDGSTPYGATWGGGAWSALGSQPFTLPTQPNTVGNPIWVGHGRWSPFGGGTTYFSGTLDEVAVYNYALPAGRVAAHYAASSYSPRRVTSVIDARGNQVAAFTYNDDSAITTVVNALGQTSYYTFQKPGGRTISYTDAAGDTTTYVWNGTAAYRLDAIISPAGVENLRLTNGAAPVGQQSQLLVSDTQPLHVDSKQDYVAGNGSLPPGATTSSTNENWIWDSAVELRPGVTTHVSTPGPGTHQHYFQLSSGGITIPAGATVTQWVYIQPGPDAPDEIMLQFFADNSWEHRVFWGHDLIQWGTDLTAARRYMGLLPPAGRWIALNMSLGPGDPISTDVAGHTLTGMAWTAYGGNAKVWWGPTTLDFPGANVATPVQAITSYAYSGANDLLASEDPNGIATVNDYDSSGLLRQTSNGIRPASPVLFEDSLAAASASLWTFENQGLAGNANSTGSSSTTQHSGVGSLTEQQGTNSLSDLYRDISGLSPGTLVRASVWVSLAPAATNGGGSGGVALGLDDGLSPALLTTRTALVQPSGWVQLVLPFVVDTSGTVRVRLWQQNYNGTSYWSDLRLDDISPAPDVTMQHPRATYFTDFEQSSDRSTWTSSAPANTSVDMHQDTGLSHSGAWSAHQNASNATSTSTWYRTVSLTPGLAYTVNAWVRTVAAGTAAGSGGLTIQVHAGASCVSGSCWQPSSVLQTGGVWQLVSFSFNVPVTSQPPFRLDLVQQNFWGDSYVDDLTLQPALYSPASEIGRDLSAQVMADKPLAYYRLDDATGTTVADSSGSGITGAVNGTVYFRQPSLVSGDGDSAMTFDGTTGYVSTPTLTPLQGDNARTIELWFKTSSSAQQGFFDSGSTGTNAQAFDIALTQQGGVGGSPSVNTPGIYVAFWGDDLYLPNLYLADGRPHHVVVTLSGTTVYVYVDGRMPAGMVMNTSWSALQSQPFTLPLVPNTAANAVWIGQARQSFWGVGSAYFTGTIDEAAIYAGALPASRVGAHYGAGWLASTAGGSASWATSDPSGVFGNASRHVAITSSTALGDVSDSLITTTLRNSSSYVVSAWVTASVASTIDMSLRDASGNPLTMDLPTSCSVGPSPTLCENPLTYGGADYAPVQLLVQYGGPQGTRDVYISHPLIALDAQRFDYNATGKRSRTYDVYGHSQTVTYDANGLYPTQTAVSTSGSGASMTTTSNYNAVGQLMSTSVMNGTQQIVDLNQRDSWGRATATIQNYQCATSSCPGAAFTDAQTNVRTGYAYDADGNLVDTYEQGQTAGNWVDTHSVYDQNGNLTSKTQNYVAGGAQSASQNVTTTWKFDALNRITDVLTPPPGCSSGCATTDRHETYDAAGRLSSEILNYQGTQDVSQANVTTSYSYDADGRQTDINTPISANGQAGSIDEHKVYDGIGRLIADIKSNSVSAQVSNAGPAETDYTLDPGGRTVSQVSPPTGSSGVRVVTQFDLDDLGRALSTTVDATGTSPARTRTVFDPRGAIHQWSPPTQQLSAGMEASTYFDLAGHQTKVVADEMPGAAAAPDVNVTSTTTYDVLGRPTDVQDPNLIVTHTDYDALNRPIDVVIDPSGLNLKTSYVYDLSGNRAQVISPRDGTNRVDLATYDALGRITSVYQNYSSSLPADYQTNIKTSYTYDQLGNRLTAADPLSRTAVTNFDALGRTVAAIQNCVGSSFAVCGTQGSDQNVTTSWQYDAAGDKVSQTDNAGLVTKYAYDSLLRLASVTENAGSANQSLTTTYTYDAVGNLLSSADALNEKTTYTVDDFSRTTKVTDASNNTKTTSYDAAGNVVSTTVGTQTNAYKLDRMNRVTSIGYLHANGATGNLSYAYDAGGRVTTFSQDGGTATTVLYDNAGRVKQVSGPSPTTTYTYYLDGAEHTVLDATGTTTYGEDQVGRIASAQDPLDGTALTTYTFDAGGRLLNRKEATGVGSAFSYSGIDQIASKTANASGASSAFASWTNQFDLDGNRKQEVSQLPGDTAAGTAAFTYDALNQLATASLPSQQPLAYAYDSAHDRCLSALSTSAVTCATATQPGWISYSYAANDGLQSSTAYGSTANTTNSYAVDAYGNQQHDSKGHLLKYDTLNRLESVQDASTGNTLASFTYDAIGRLVQVVENGATTKLVYRGLEEQVVQLTDGTGNVQQSYAWDSRGRMLTLNTGGQNYFVLTDPHGDTVGLATGAGNVVATRHYDAWGQPIASSGSVSIPFGFQSGYTDAVSGLDKMGLRWYDPSAGRFVSSDPTVLSHALQEPIGRQRWEYAANSPLVFSDPSGLYEVANDPGNACDTDCPSLTPTPLFPNPYADTQTSGTATYAGGWGWTSSGGTVGSVTVQQPTSRIASIIAPVATLSPAATNGSNRLPDLTGWWPTSPGLITPYGLMTGPGSITPDWLRKERNDLARQCADDPVCQTLILGVVGGAEGAAVDDAEALGVAKNSGNALVRSAPEAAETLMTGAPQGARTGVLRVIGDTKVYQRDDLIDLGRTDAVGRTNADRMAKGLPPIGPDGQPINLHHIGQCEGCALQEMTKTYHSSNYSALHSNTGQEESLIDRAAFNQWRSAYWVKRLIDLIGLRE